MDPLAVLRRCMHYLHLHPEMYGTDLELILNKELLYVLQADAAENSLIATAPSPSPPLPPLQTHSLPSSARRSYKDKSFRSKTATSTTRAQEPLFTGTNGITLLHPGPGFFSLVEKAKNYSAASNTLVLGGTTTPSADPAGWNATLPPGQPLIEPEGTLPPDQHPRNLLAGSLENSPEEATPEENSVYMGSRGKMSFEGPTTPPPNPVVVVDGGGYEISFLRGQMQQIEAAYNSKCVKMRELEEENTFLTAQLKSAESTSKERAQELGVVTGKMDAMRRELETLRDKVSEQSSQRRSEAKKAKVMVAESGEGEVKQELEKMGALWRETEKALQEARRSLENAEKEANQSHDHLQDAFKYIERLERRVARRDRFITLSGRRQRSLEEKYEKLMWCFDELSCLTGAHSYVDFLLVNHPMWSLFLFARLQRHTAGQALVTERSSGTLESDGITFIRTPSGGKLILKEYHSNLVYRTMTREIFPATDAKTKQLRINLLGSVGCRSLRPFGLYAIDYLGGEDKSPDGGDLNQKCLPVLTVASLLLPLRTIDATNKQRIVSREESTGLENQSQYDQTTLRYILRNYWESRVKQFKQKMNLHRDAAIKQFTNQGREEAEEEGAGRVENRNSFLGALIAFLVKFTSPDATEVDEAAQYVIRGVSDTMIKELVDKGRVMFASVTKVGAAESPETQFTDLLPVKVREILFALYHYSMEYKETDSDFRLFYLVSHQLIPEMVGVNFYVSLEAIREDCQKVWRSTLRLETAARGEEAEDESSRRALQKVTNLVDTTPIIAEDRTIEVDSDGEGYGTILQSKGEISSKAEPEPVTEEQLVHNIRDYLESIKRDQQDSRPEGKPDEKGEQEEVIDLPDDWDRLNAQIEEALAPHSELLSVFRELQHTDTPDAAVCLKETRKRRAVQRDLVSPFVSAARGLLSVDVVMSILKKHLFTTYAVSCTGTPRFSLSETLLPPMSDKKEDYMNPLDRVGQIEPSKTQLQRLRFSLALDFASSLVPHAKLFDVDTHTGTPSHLYDEYLTQTLDLFQEQQQYLMNVLLSCCATTHEHLFEEGAEECDGNVTLKSLKVGFTTALQRCAMAHAQSSALVQHFINYDRILRVEDEVRFEQFADAPFLINSPSDETVLGGIPPNQSWDIDDETQTCSLLNLANAVRLSYLVWGFNARPCTTRLQTELSTAYLINAVAKSRRSNKAAPQVNYIKLNVPKEPEERMKYAAYELVERFKSVYIASATQMATGEKSNLLRQTERKSARGAERTRWEGGRRRRRHRGVRSSTRISSQLRQSDAAVSLGGGREGGARGAGGRKKKEGKPTKGNASPPPRRRRNQARHL
ncbi:hypothetical protein AGDE_12656 [Angomonas deanei]|uniref:Uncharacterized protein n=1 Tax=Angomonas deanei TaxID=59799 RepID=A0A7G2C8E7_9TRYP|nr:hypothetical protein AGDE_12656 [Angomonas deanei]CAD2215013.1 hypothetical protein, conserved [Angomonas deanei]|eukprot:EPY23891.1 hypothetical protein AGDE_12656 [Angomonas deanei]